MVGKLWKGCLLLTLLLLVGCQATTGHYLGALADSERVIGMDAARVDSQRWQDLHLTIDSELRQDSGQQILSGRVSFSLHPKIMHTRADNLTLRVFFLDERNRVVGYQTVTRIVSYNLEETIPFSLVVTDAGSAVAYTFGYDVTFADGNDDPGARHWNYPRSDR